MMTVQDMRILILKFAASDDLGQRRLGNILSPILQFPNDVLIDAVRQQLNELESACSEFSRQWTVINGE